MKKLLVEKKENYARYVREMHLPSKSRLKEQELQDMIQSLKHPVKKAVKHPPGSSVQRSRSFNKSGLSASVS